MTKAELINYVKAEITLSCALPYSLNEAEITRLIAKSERWFYENYKDAVERKIIPVPLAIYENPHFTETRSIYFPECVVSAFDLRESNASGIIGQPQGDFADSKLLGAEIFLSPFQGDNLVYRTAMYSYYDLAQAYDLKTVACKWNPHTHRLSVVGRTPKKDTFVSAWVKIPQESLYESDLFTRYVIAEAKINLGRTLGLFSYNLAGGIQVNFDDIKQEGKEELEQVKSQIDEENSPDWFFQWH